MFVVLFINPASFMARLDAFAVASAACRILSRLPEDAVTAAGIDLNPPFSLLATLLVAPIAWTSLQWATYRAQQNGEIKDARPSRARPSSWLAR